MKNLKQWIADGDADRLKARGRVIDFIGMAFIVIAFFLLTLLNVTFRLKLGEEDVDSLECVRNYAKPGAGTYHEEREALIKTLF